MNSPEEEQGAGASSAGLNAAISRAVVRIRQRYVGRGPARATAFFRHNMVVVVMEDTMTAVEQSLAGAGNDAMVREMRHELEQTMAVELKAAIERLTGCKVNAFLSASNVDPDVSCHLYTLDRPVQVPVQHASVKAVQSAERMVDTADPRLSSP